MRRLRAVCGITLGLVLMVVGVAYAHATLLRSDPIAGETLRASPSRVWLLFNEPLESGLARVTITGTDGRVIRLAAAGDPHDVHAIVAPVVEPLTPGAYRINWHVVSADGHPVDGTYAITVGDRAVSATPPPPAPVVDAGVDSVATSPQAGVPVIAAVLRGAGVGLLMALGGLLLFVVTSDAPAERALRWSNWIAVGSAVFLALHLFIWAKSVAPDNVMSAATMSDVMQSGVARADVWRTGLAVLALWALALARRPRLALMFVVSSLLASAAVGHSAAIVPVVAIPAKAVHLVASSVWLGGVIYLLACLRGSKNDFVREAHRISAAALVAVVLVALTGVVQTLVILPSPSVVFRSTYGAVVLAKIVGLVVLVAFGAHHRYRVLPRLGGDAAHARTFDVSLRGEIAVMAIVALLGGLLAYVPPPRG